MDDLSFDASVSDLETVADAAELDRFSLLGISQGGPVAVEYAVRHPERVSHLILMGAYARGAARRGESQDEIEARRTLTRRGWGRDDPTYQLFWFQFMAEATIERMHWYIKLQRVSSSSENAYRIQSELGQIHVLDRLTHVSAPTLVLHARDDARVPFSEGRQLAAMIPDARFVPLESKNHLLLETEPAWQITLWEIRRFLGTGPGEAAHAAYEEAPSSSSAAGYPDSLTGREVEVLRLVAAGRSNPQIADELFISVKTVGNHVSNTLNKVSVSNRSEAAAYAVRQGLA